MQSNLDYLNLIKLINYLNFLENKKKRIYDEFNSLTSDRVKNGAKDNFRSEDQTYFN